MYTKGFAPIYHLTWYILYLLFVAFVMVMLGLTYHLLFISLIIYPAVPCSGVNDDTEQTRGGR